MRILSNQGRQELFRLAETLIVVLPFWWSASDLSDWSEAIGTGTGVSLYVVLRSVEVKLDEVRRKKDKD